MEYYLAIKRSTDTQYNMSEPWKHYAKWKKPVTKDCVIWPLFGEWLLMGYKIVLGDKMS